MRDTIVKYMESVEIPDEVLPQNILGKDEPQTSELHTAEITEITPEIFLEIIRAQQLTGDEFLEILGNSRLSKSAYNEIQDDAELSTKRLIEIFKEEGFTSDDFKDILIDVNEFLKSASTASTEEAELINSDEDDEKKLTYRKASDFDSADDYYPGINRARMIFASVLAVLLFVGSFALRYYYTGSILITEPPVVDDSINTQEKLFALFETGEENELARAVLPAQASTEYSVKGAVASPEILSRLVSYEKHTLYCNGNTLSIIGTIGGQMEHEKEIVYEGELLGVAVINGKFAVVSQKKDEPFPFSYNVEKKSTDENGEEITEIITLNDTLLKDIVTIELFDGENPVEPISVYNQTGTLSKLIEKDESLIVITSDNAAQNRQESAPETYIPYSETDGKRTLLPLENMFVPFAPQTRGYLVLGECFFAEKLSAAPVHAILGASGQAYLDITDEWLYIGHNGGSDGSAVIRYGIENAAPDSYLFTDGSFSSACALDEGKETVRFTAHEKDAMSLFIYSESAFVPVKAPENNEGEPIEEEKTKPLISKMDGLSEGNAPLCTYFDENAVYIASSGTEEISLYGVNTINPDELFELERIECSDRELLNLDDDNALGLSYETNEAGERTALVLELYDISEGIPERVSDYKIKAESTIDGNWSKYLSTPVENKLSSLAVRDGRIFLPVTYFDGISEIEKFIVLEWNEGRITELGYLIEYDVRAKELLMTAGDNVFFCVMDGLIKSARIADFIVISELETN